MPNARYHSAARSDKIVRAAAASGGHQWEVETDVGWAPFDPDIEAAIRTAVEQGRQTLDFQRGRWKYRVTFLRPGVAEQLNLSTNAKRQMRNLLAAQLGQQGSAGYYTGASASAPSAPSPSQTVIAKLPPVPRRSPLQLAIDGKRWDEVLSLAGDATELRKFSEDLRSPLTAAIEHCDQRGVVEALLRVDAALGATHWRVALELWSLIQQGTAAKGRDWERIAPEIVRTFSPNQRSNCDVFVLAMERCPSVRARKAFLSHEGTAAALWRASLDMNHPDLARQLAVWIGLSMGSLDGPNSSGRHLLDMRIDGKSVLGGTLEKAAQDERWIRVAKVMVNLGARTNPYLAEGKSTLLYALEQAEKQKAGFRELISSLLDRLGTDVDQWEQPTVLLEERSSECPICLESLWISTPTAFVTFVENNPRIICTHFFCFDCAGLQVMEQQKKHAAQMQCPLCRNNARDVMPLPDLTMHPRLWFNFLDLDGNRRLSQNTLVQALEAMLPLDTEKLYLALTDHLWSMWDQNKDGTISEEVFFAPGGLLEWVRCHLHELQTGKERGKPPSMDDSPERWFRYWDWKQRGSMRRAELFRALCQAARISSLDIKQVQLVKEKIEEYWARRCNGHSEVPLDVFVRDGHITDIRRIVNGLRAQQ